MGKSGAQLLALVQYSRELQSASVAHAAPVHWCVSRLHEPARHCSSSLQSPSPAAIPQRLSAGSHTADWQTALPTTIVQVATRPGSEGNGTPLASLGVHCLVVSLHHWLALQSVSTVQPGTHRPLASSHTLPGLSEQSSFVTHTPHVPAFVPDLKQSGASPLRHGCAEVESLSPSQATHTKCSVSQMGVFPLQLSVLVHATQSPLLVSHTGVAPPHCASSVQPTQVPFRAPVVAHLPERHTASPLAAVHGPEPLARPHSSSFVSHTPLSHTRLAASSVQVPSRVGLVCGLSFGIATPLSSLGKHAFKVSLHHRPSLQSASALQPAAGSHRPFVLHVAERHTVAPFCAVHGPSPSA